MKIKVPNEIQIGCHSYKVFLKDKTTNDYNGDTYHLKEMMRVRKDLPPIQQGVTLLHEALHFISEVYTLRLEEQDINLLAEGLGQLLFSNLGVELDWSGIATMTATIETDVKNKE